MTIRIETASGAVYELDLDARRVRRSADSTTGTSQLVIDAGGWAVESSRPNEHDGRCGLESVVRLVVDEPAVFVIRRGVGTSDSKLARVITQDVTRISESA